ncbi:unnamed protein product [Prorocentrum cordatum]|uniref:Uncharacterized protein n=1 Tax=Prorocentrum cordatum TaxID=2364126 RepID=A0ABN9R0M7_9DINO|nr:unnamed protein product [Polarella glacialis]
MKAEKMKAKALAEQQEAAPRAASVDSLGAASSLTGDRPRPTRAEEKAKVQKAKKAEKKAAALVAEVPAGMGSCTSLEVNFNSGVGAYWYRSQNENRQCKDAARAQGSGNPLKTCQILGSAAPLCHPLRAGPAKAALRAARLASAAAWGCSGPAAARVSSALAAARAELREAEATCALLGRQALRRMRCRGRRRGAWGFRRRWGRAEPEARQKPSGNPAAGRAAAPPLLVSRAPAGPGLLRGARWAGPEQSTNRLESAEALPPRAPGPAGAARAFRRAAEFCTFQEARGFVMRRPPHDQHRWRVVWESAEARGQQPGHRARPPGRGVLGRPGRGQRGLLPHRVARAPARRMSMLGAGIDACHIRAGQDRASEDPLWDSFAQSPGWSVPLRLPLEPKASCLSSADAWVRAARMDPVVHQSNEARSDDAGQL